MAQVLQTVLKRELTFEEAMAIAQDMVSNHFSCIVLFSFHTLIVLNMYPLLFTMKDTNEDGVFSLSELQQWADSNIIIKLAEDGREKDVDELITKRLEDFNAGSKKKLDPEAEEWKGI